MKGRDTKSVSNWKRGRAEHFGIFYDEEESELQDFMRMISNCDHKFVCGSPARYTYPLKDKSKLLDSLLDITKEYLNVSFNIDEETELPDFFKGTVKKEIAATKKKIWERGVKVDNNEENDRFSAAKISKETGLSR
jgi:hypothetical protein